MVVVAQLVESRIVIPVVVGSSPIVHPTEYVVKTKGYRFMSVTLFVCLDVILVSCRADVGFGVRLKDAHTQSRQIVSLFLKGMANL